MSASMPALSARRRIISQTSMRCIGSAVRAPRAAGGPTCYAPWRATSKLRIRKSATPPYFVKPDQKQIEAFHEGPKDAPFQMLNLVRLHDRDDHPAAAEECH